ncbi:MAG: tRNA (adenosine(37)-N6)-threonylcarbamoyltransferase complex ATPase subunit type 1 TsaE [Prevotella sp.]|nr:tRNA (adenosine(37)-N6)-threonylcarbamoyltransferase complex ATPase subunit type 1 TsaE [Prevotella sp.]
MTIKIENLEGIAAAAREFIAHISDRRVFAFYGSMGAGKTTFIKAVCEALGVEDVITSPTFAIVNEYSLPPTPPNWSESNNSPLHLEGAGGRLFHFDFYRIKKLEEVFDMGYEDYFYSGSLCFIEWPELIEPLLPDDAVSVMIEVNADNTRSIKF